MIIISLMGMTDASTDENRVICGDLYSILIGFNCSVHFFFLFKSTYTTIKLKLKRRSNLKAH